MYIERLMKNTYTNVILIWNTSVYKNTLLMLKMNGRCMAVIIGFISCWRYFGRAPDSNSAPPFPRHVIDMGSGANLWSRYIGDRHHAHQGSPPSSPRHSQICTNVEHGYGNVQLKKLFLDL
jgi:hypothetical protein